MNQKMLRNKHLALSWFGPTVSNLVYSKSAAACLIRIKIQGRRGFAAVCVCKSSVCLVLILVTFMSHLCHVPGCHAVLDRCQVAAFAQERLKYQAICSQYPFLTVLTLFLKNSSSCLPADSKPYHTTKAHGPDLLFYSYRQSD